MAVSLPGAVPPSGCRCAVLWSLKLLGATAMTTCLIPIVVNVATGLAATERVMEDVLKALGASRWRVLRNVGLPRAMPYFFASLKIAVTLAFIGTVLSERSPRTAASAR